MRGKLVAMANRPVWFMWLAPVFIRIWAAAPRMVQPNTSPTGWRRPGFSKTSAEFVATAFKYGAPFHTEYQAFATMVDCGTKESGNRGRSEERSADDFSQRRPTTRLYRRMDGHHHPAAVRHYHAGAGFRHPHRIHGRHAADWRPPAGGQAGVRASPGPSPSTFFRTTMSNAAISSCSAIRWISGRPS